MRTRTLGSQGLDVAELGLGCMGMSYAYGQGDDQESIATIRRALDLGVTMLDTADMYGPWTNEKLVGRAIADRREKVVVATKFGNEISDDGVRTGEVNSRPEYIRQAVEGSLRRLGLEHIDLYYQHRVDPTVPVADTFGALAELVDQGKVRYLGMSEAAPDTIRAAHAVHPITALQTEYSLFSREPEDNDVLATVRELGIGFVAYSPLGRGFLSGEIRRFEDLSENDGRRSWPRFQGENFAKNLAVVDKVREIAERKSVTTAQLAVAWVLAQGEDIVPIPGTKRRAYLEDNIGAAAVELSQDDLAAIEAVAPQGVAAGERYPESHLSKVHL
jgi:aryl-alcohol dehydrogenase-like predicted oxidoreductase